MERLDLGIVLLNWNGLQDTLACLTSIYADPSVPAYLVLVAAFATGVWPPAAARRSA
jgi:hypothetical protein